MLRVKRSRQTMGILAMFGLVTLLTTILLQPIASAEKTSPAIGEIEGYTSWDFARGPFEVTPGMAALCIHRPFAGHPGTESARYGRDMLITVYANDAAASLIRTGGGDPDSTRTFAVGSVIVKQKLAENGDAERSSLGVMIKRDPGFDEENGDWEFLFQAADGRVARGSSEMPGCYNCHRQKSWASVRTLDFVFVDRYRRSAD